MLHVSGGTANTNNSQQSISSNNKLSIPAQQSNVTTSIPAASPQVTSTTKQENTSNNNNELPPQPPISTSTPTGSLKVDFSAPSTEDSELTSSSTTLKKPPTSTSTILKKSSSNNKKKIAAKKLDISPVDARFDSFEAVERQVAKASQEASDYQLAAELQKEESESSNLGYSSNSHSSGSSRIASAYAEAEASLYRPPATSSSPYTGSSGKSPYSKAISGSNSSSSGTAATAETYMARDKYSNAKGISSDQFFGLDQEESVDVRNKLDRFSNSNAISSDMLYGNEPPPPPLGASGNPGVAGNAGQTLGNKLKSSVKDILGDLQRRLG